MGVLQPDGSFVLSTYGTNDGAVVGEHSVTIINVKSPSTASADSTLRGKSAAATPKFDRARAPGNYRVVAGKDNHFDIKLSHQDIERYTTHN